MEFFAFSECVHVCALPLLPFTSAAKTHQHVSLPSTKVLCTSVRETGVSVFQLATAVLQNALKIPLLLTRSCTSQDIQCLNCLLPVSITPHSMCLKQWEIELELLLSLISLKGPLGLFDGVTFTMQSLIFSFLWRSVTFTEV